MPPREKYLDTVAAYLADEQARKAGKPALKPTRVFRNDPNALRGLETADVSPDGVVLGRRPDSDRAALEAEGYEWRPVDEYATVVSNPQAPVAPPPGKLPFISGTPTHQGKPATDVQPPASGLEQAMSLAATSARPLAGTQPSAPPPLATPAPAAPPAKKRGGSREAMLVSKTTETGSTPTARPYVPLDTSAPATGQDRFQGLPEGVASFLRKRSGLEEAQQDANRRAMAVELASAFNQVGSGIAGSRYNPNAFDAQREAAQQPVADYMARTQEGRTEDALARQHDMDERALQDAAREAQRQEREFQYRQGRDKAGDVLKREGMKNEMDIARMRAEEASKDRYLRHQDLLLRAKEGAEIRKAAADQKRQDMLARQDEKDIQALGQATSKAPFGEFQKALEDVDRLAPGLVYGQPTKDSPMSAGDRVARSLPFGVGNWAVSDEGQQYGAAVSNLRDLVSRMRSGAVLNAGEEKHYLSLLGDEVFSDPRRAAAGINAVREGLAQKLHNAQAAYAGSGGALDKYEAAGGTTFRAPIFGAAPTGEEIEMPNGDVFQVLADGTARKVQR